MSEHYDCRKNLVVSPTQLVEHTARFLRILRLSQNLISIGYCGISRDYNLPWRTYAQGGFALCQGNATDIGRR
jgi:hypothetical protein